MNDTHREILAWDLPTRAFHWLLVLSFLGAYLSGFALSPRAGGHDEGDDD